jgi:uncharacterized protein YccT (UPF0319 family)
VPSAKPIKSYLEALEKYNQGDKEAAAQKLAQSLGAEKPSGVIISSIDKLLATGTMPNDAVLKIISTEVAKGKDG